MANTVAFSGNQIVVTISDKDGKDVVIGLAQDLQATESFRPEPVSGLGSPRVQEYVSTMYEIGLSMSACMINTPKEGDPIPFGSGNSNTGKISTFIPDVGSEQKAREYLNSNLNGCTITVYYTRPDTAKSLRKYGGCVFESADISVRKHGILMTNARFKAAYVSSGTWE